MPVHLLMISPGGDHANDLSVHPDQSAAWTALIDYIDERWTAIVGPFEPPEDETKRVESFFRHSGYFYLIAEVTSCLSLPVWRAVTNQATGAPAIC